MPVLSLTDYKLAYLRKVLRVSGGSMSDLELQYWKKLMAGSIGGTDGVVTSTNLLPSIMTTPPVVALSAANVASAITTPVVHDGLDPALRFLGAIYVPNPTGIGGYVNTVSSAGVTRDFVWAGRMQFEYEAYGDDFEILMQVVGTTLNYRIFIDEVPVTATAVIVNGLAAGAFYRLRVTHPSVASRRIRVELFGANYVGIFATAAYTMWYPTRALGKKTAWIGDSLTDGTFANSYWESWACLAGQLLNWNVIPSPVGGTGYLANGGGGGKVKYRDRFVSDIVPIAPDQIVFSGSYNDSGFTPAAIQDEANALYALAKQTLPNANLIVVGPQVPVAVTAPGTYTYIRDALKAAAVANGAQFIDPVGYPNATSWITAANQAAFISTIDNVHPTVEGHRYEAKRFASAQLATR